jgi:pimeloyl-ACP methyl ester carboxylesterase
MFTYAAKTTLQITPYSCPMITSDAPTPMIPDLSYNLFEKSGHFPMVEEQELFDQKLVEWIGRTIT